MSKLPPDSDYDVPSTDVELSSIENNFEEEQLEKLHEAVDKKIKTAKKKKKNRSNQIHNTANVSPNSTQEETPDWSAFDDSVPDKNFHKELENHGFEEKDDSINPAHISCFAYSRITGLSLGPVLLSKVGETLFANPDAYVWIEMTYPSIEDLQTTQEEFKLHDLAIEDASRTFQRAKIENYGDSLFVVLRTVQMHKHDVAFGTTYLFLSQRYLITIRNNRSQSYQSVRLTAQRHPDKMRYGPSYPFYMILDHIVDEYAPVVDELTDYLKTLENSIFSSKFNKKTLRDLYNLKSDIVRFRTSISPVEDVCNFFILQDHKLAGAALVPPSASIYFRDVRDHVVRALDAVQGLSDMLQSAMDTYIAMIGISQNEIVKKLASWAAILAVPTLITSCYGMNFDNMPELHSQYGYPITVLVMIIVTLIVYRKLKNEGWL